MTRSSTPPGPLKSKSLGRLDRRSALGKNEPCEYQPNETRESREWNQEKGPRKEQADPARLAASSQHEAECDQPFGKFAFAGPNLLAISEKRSFSGWPAASTSAAYFIRSVATSGLAIPADGATPVDAKPAPPSFRSAAGWSADAASISRRKHSSADWYSATN